MKIALLSNVTVEVLARMLAPRHAVWTPPGFGGWMATALATPAALKDFAPEAIFLVLDPTHAPASDGDRAAALAALARAFPAVPVREVDLADLAEGAADFFDERMWSLASQPWSLAGLEAIAGEIERLLATARGPVRKVLALDLDNTLWEGVVSEVGAAGIRPRVDFQRGIRALKERGVLLAALSKNDEATALAAFGHPDMVLAPGDFVALKIDWRDKADNLKDLAGELNLGTDAFVFVDDRASERERMRRALPEVAVPDFPISARRLARLHFPAGTVTDEDRRKTEIYRGAADRRKLAATLSFDEYLKRLAVQVAVAEAVEGDFERVAQLSQKSNQFNLATNRYAAEDLRALAGDGRHRLFVARVSDRYADDGLTAFALVRRDSPDTATLVDFVLSCRVMNRRVENRFLAEIKSRLASSGIRRLAAVARPNGRNAAACEFFVAPIFCQ